MHIKSFVLASFAASIATAIPVPQSCPFNWKRSAQKGCVPQTAPLPSLLPYLSDPSSMPNPATAEYYNNGPFGTTSPTTPMDTAVTDTRPPPKPLTDYAPWVGAGGLGTWGLTNWWKSRGSSPAGEAGQGN